MAVGLSILDSILTTSLHYSIVQYGNKSDDYMLKLIVIHHHRKAQGIPCEPQGVLSCWAFHDKSSV
jgi:hypothetical protein